MSDASALAPAPMSAGEPVNIPSEAATTAAEASVPVEANSQDKETLTPALSQRERESETNDAETARQTAREAAARDAEMRELAERGQLAQLVASSPRLPPGLAARLSEVIGRGGFLHEVVAAIEEALPAAALVTSLSAAAPQVSQPVHPAGEAFFSGDPAAQADERAATLAREQLAGSGMLRGQRVRQA
jgi:hypothetical protein